MARGSDRPRKLALMVRTGNSNTARRKIDKQDWECTLAAKSGECLVLDVHTMPNVSIPTAIKHREEIIERLAAGELVREIADSLGCHRMSISTVLAKDPEYQAAIAEAIEARMEKYEAALDSESLNDGLSLARVKEQLSHVRWKAERLLSHKYGQVRQAVQVNTEGPATINIVSWADDAT